MGAEPWSCFVAYQEDITAAPQAAQAQEFAAGRYRIFDPNDVPATIDEARAQADADGTCSILDIQGVIDTPHEVVDEQYMGTDYGMAAPLAPDLLLELFDTEKPTRAEIGDGGDIYSWLDRGIASYVIVYDDRGSPSEIFFAGYSFD